MTLPTIATLYMTNKCNFKCKYCYRQHHSIEQAPDMSIQMVDDFLRIIPSIKSICVCGYGEPLLCSTLPDILEYLKSKNIFIGLITNGTYLKSKIDIIKAHMPGYVSISLNAPNAILHEKITGVKEFDNIVDGIRECQKTGVKMYVSYICAKDNIAHVPEFLDFVKSFGNIKVHLHNLLPHFSDDSDAEFWDLVLTTKDQAIIDEIAKSPNASIIDRYPILIEKNSVHRNCRFPWSMIGINGNGNYTVCNVVYPPRHVNGNIKDDIVWNSTYCEEFRNSILNEQKNACKKCFRNWEK